MEVADDFDGFASFENNDSCQNNEEICWEPLKIQNNEKNFFSSYIPPDLTSFFPDNLKKKEVYKISLETNLSKSNMFDDLASKNRHDPVKFKETTYYEFKIESILELLKLNQDGDETSILSLTNKSLGCWRDQFNFHKILCPSMESSSSSKKSSLPTNTANRPSEVKLQNARSLVPSDIPQKNNRNIKNLPDEKIAMDNANEFNAKTTEELKQIVLDIEDKINSYSENLLIELDSREKNKREKEIKNSFIASYIAVEAKLNQFKRKKAGFFKYADEPPRNSPISIPYFENGEGVSVDDLHSMTKILQAMERDDVDVSRLIAEYVINVGEKHELETIIQIRNENGVVTPISSPTKAKVTINR